MPKPKEKPLILDEFSTWDDISNQEFIKNFHRIPVEISKKRLAEILNEYYKFYIEKKDENGTNGKSENNKEGGFE